jgi:hypothetical protein
LRASDESGVAFRIFLRAPFALLDAGSAFLLLLLLGASPWRFVAAACYWLNPLAIILSAYHGNTDCAVALFLLLALWFISKEKLIPAAIVVGASLWIKLPGVVAIPALIFFIPKWKHRFVFLAVVGVVALVVFPFSMVSYSGGRADQRLRLCALLVFVRQSLASRGLGLQRPPLLAFSNRRASQRRVSILFCRRGLVCDLDYSPGIPSPPVIFFISDWASALPCSIACCTPLKTASSRNSTSFGSTISCPILIERISPAPFAVTFIFPPAAVTWTVFSSSSA